MGADGTVVEVVVMDMTGKAVATIIGQTHLGLTNLASGNYLARVRIQKDNNEESVSYLKLVKK